MRVFLIMRARVLRQHLFQNPNLFFCHSLRQQKGFYCIRYFYLQLIPLAFIHKATAGLRMTVGIHHIGLDVINRSTVHQIGTLHMNYRTAATLPLHMRQTHRRQSDVVGTKRTAGGKDTHLLVAAQYRRTNHRTLGSMPVGRKLPYQPQIVKTLYAPKRICVALFGLKDDLSLQLCHQSSLLGNTKLTLER